jgi:hypothetical protein
MEDLRKNYNVNTKTKFSPLFWWKKNKNIIKLFGIIGAIALVIFRPDLIGSYIGTWFNNLVTAFTNNSDVTITQWFVILATVLIGFICYKLLQKRSKG